jgi:hypothetical protein
MQWLIILGRPTTSAVRTDRNFVTVFPRSELLSSIWVGRKVSEIQEVV